LPTEAQMQERSKAPEVLKLVKKLMYSALKKARVKVNKIYKIRRELLNEALNPQN